MIDKFYPPVAWDESGEGWWVRMGRGGVGGWVGEGEMRGMEVGGWEERQRGWRSCWDGLIIRILS